MSAGASARYEAARCCLRIADYERRLRVERSRAAAFEVAGRTEAQVAVALRAMDGWGWRLLEDRRWPGTRGANIDLIAIGPGGVLVIDVKCWAEPDVVEGRLYRGQDDATPDLDRVRAQSAAVADVVAELGLTPIEVLPVLVFVGQDNTDLSIGPVKILDDRSLVPWAVSRGLHLAPDRIAALTALLTARLPPARGVGDDPGGVLAVASALEPVVPIGRHTETSTDELFDTAALEQAVFEHAVSRSSEEWMTWLHPDQMRLVRRHVSGASRIRGPAGTGKTVVALHRAAYLAQALGGPILFTTFVTTLPPVLATLYERLSPQTTGRIEFTSLHKWASAMLRGRGHRISIDSQRADTCFALAWAHHGRGTTLESAGVTARYCQEEIDSVIKGRGLVDFDDYAALRRIGRRIRLTTAHRELVWAVYVDYESRLRGAGLIDFNDLLALARTELQDHPLEQPFAVVIADEVQDLNCLAVRLLAELSDGGERLLLIGDGQQQIYPGGYTLAEAGVSVTGRSTVLTVNYRNPSEIVLSALEVVADDVWNDLEDGDEVGRRDITTARSGGLVHRENVTTLDDLRDAVVRQVWSLLEAGHPASGIAVLCTTNAEVRTYAAMLRSCGLPVLTLDRYVGQPRQAIKVGTVKRAKGLEFADVIHPVLPAATGNDISAEAGAEARALTNRTKYVAMTRARDTVWVGSIA